MSSFTKSDHNNVFHFDWNVDNKLLSHFMPVDRLKEAKSIVQRYQQNRIDQLKHERNTTIYPLEPVIAQIPHLIASEMTNEEVKQRILFELMSHEFGHVLNLRHNFYGSFDERHWHRDNDNKPILQTSSVMDYLNIKNRATSPMRSLYGPYDEAALVYAYSNGQKDLSQEKDTQYLFCTDHHRFTNALCNPWDKGSTPSQVMMGLIENYEERYDIINSRIKRAYWNTRWYGSYIFGTMMDMKQMLAMWQTAFTNSQIPKELDDSIKDYKVDDVNFISHQVQKDIRQALKLNMAFYNSVLQLSSSDRDWQTHYHRESGSVESIGIFWDKFFAMYFLMGDDPILYNPNYYLSRSSYLMHLDNLGFRQMIEEIMENTLTVRVDMENWFIDFSRLLYAQNGC